MRATRVALQGHEYLLRLTPVEAEHLYALLLRSSPPDDVLSAQMAAELLAACNDRLRRQW